MIKLNYIMISLAYIAAGVGICCAGGSKAMKAAQIRQDIHSGNKIMTLPHREGAKFSRHVRAVKQYCPSVYHGNVLTPGYHYEYLHISKSHFTFEKYPEVSGYATPMPSEKIFNNIKGKQTGIAKEYYFYIEDGIDKIVSDDKETIAKALGNPGSVYLLVIGAILILLGICNLQ